MYAIVNINGIQTKVAPDAVLDVPHLIGQPGEKLSFGQVLLLADGDKIAVGRPFVQGAGVSAEVVDQLRGPKLRIFKYKRRNDYRKRRGHRDTITRIRITGIKA